MKTGQFFFIDNTEGLRLRELSKQIMDATRYESVSRLDKIAALFWVPGLLLFAISGVQLGDPFVQLPWAVTLGTLILGVVAVIVGFAIMFRAQNIRNTQQEIQGGAYRPYIVTAKHHSYKALLTLEARVLVADPEGWPVLRRFFISPEIVDADEKIRRHQGDVIATAESELLILERAEAVMQKLGINSGNRFTAQREAIMERLLAAIAHAQGIVDEAQELAARHAA